MFFEDYKEVNKVVKVAGGFCRKKPGSFDTVIFKPGKIDDVIIGSEYLNDVVRITIGGDIASVQLAN